MKLFRTPEFYSCRVTTRQGSLTVPFVKENRKIRLAFLCGGVDPQPKSSIILSTLIDSCDSLSRESPHAPLRRARVKSKAAVTLNRTLSRVSRAGRLVAKMENFDDDVIESEIKNFLPLLQPSLGRGDAHSSSSERRLVSNYGLRLPELALLWLHLCLRGFDVGNRRDQLLWTLYWLRVYAPESACVTHFRPTPSEKTFRAAVKKFVGFIASVNFV